ncbi:MAG: hypothetical protein ABUL62_04445 [Myxococcales bacterium]
MSEQFTGRLRGLNDRYSDRLAPRPSTDTRHQSLVAELKRLDPRFDPSGRSTEYLLGRIAHFSAKRLDAVSEARERMIERQSTAWIGQADADDDTRLDAEGMTTPEPSEEYELDDETAAERDKVEARLVDEGRSSGYIKLYLDQWTRAHATAMLTHAKMNGRSAGSSHAEAKHEAIEKAREARTDAVQEARERGELEAREQWRTPASDDESREDDGGEPGESPVDRARRENEESLRNAWRTNPE